MCLNSVKYVPDSTLGEHPLSKLMQLRQESKELSDTLAECKQVMSAGWTRLSASR